MEHEQWSVVLHLKSQIAYYHSLYISDITVPV